MLSVKKILRDKLIFTSAVTKVAKNGVRYIVTNFYLNSEKTDNNELGFIKYNKLRLYIVWETTHPNLFKILNNCLEQHKTFPVLIVSKYYYHNKKEINVVLKREDL